ncbi:helix-turn-helix domain-containing protein [Burkholderia cepacia]|uniref:helix-turn-helix domain-containing protein n=1 Tax=Burkholderia cepacia TaxID=292 RepID=UPI0015887F92|nr:helix-turn-helix domain-containing protein [Burkholderia cepacia]
MSFSSVADSYRFTTIDVPESQRFDAWSAAISTYDYALSGDAVVPFDIEFHAMRFGPFVLVRQQWLRDDHLVSYRATRTQRKIRADGIDHFYLALHSAGSLVDATGRRWEQAGSGGLCLFDMSRPFDGMFTTGDVVGLMIRRDMLHALEPGRYGDAVNPAMDAVLTEHLLTLRRNVEKLGAGDIPYVMRATSNLLYAGLKRSSDKDDDGLSAGDAVSIRRVRKFIDTNLLRADLTPTKLSEAAGVSRAKLYQLFRGDGGVMRYIQRRRLDRAYDVLTDPDMPKSRISEVAWRHGFADEKYFSRVFRARFGCMPREVTSLHGGNQPVRKTVEANLMYGPTFAQWLKSEQ